MFGIICWSFCFIVWIGILILRCTKLKNTQGNKPWIVLSIAMIAVSFLMVVSGVGNYISEIDQNGQNNPYEIETYVEESYE